ncbi:hypothetical protein JCM11491_003625 [Sporobolomyces phaffii]
MESILLLAIVGKNGAGGGGLDDLKSPTIPYPPDLDPITARTTGVLTERSLKNSHLQWMIRKRNLAARLEALETARGLSLLGTWAGDATDVHIRSVREAVAEAHWVEERLKEAVRWVNERPLDPIPLRQLLKGVKQGRVTRSFRRRPSHSDYPLVLHDLPYPLPEAPPSAVYTLTVERPPPIDRERTDHEREADGPPSYSPEADCTIGETSIERGGEVLDYQRRIDGSILGERGSRRVYGVREAIPTYWG